MTLIGVRCIVECEIVFRLRDFFGSLVMSNRDSLKLASIVMLDVGVLIDVSLEFGPVNMERDSSDSKALLQRPWNILLIQLIGVVKHPSREAVGIRGKGTFTV